MEVMGVEEPKHVIVHAGISNRTLLTFGFYLGIGAMSGVSLVYLAFKALMVIVHEMIWR